MEKWVLYALLSMVFAGCTSVIAKLGLAGIGAELGLAVRTCFVFAFVLLFAVLTVPGHSITALTPQHYVWLGLSGLTTAVSWVFYYKALQQGDVATVALIDKGSVVVAITLAALVLGETITLRVIAGAGLIVAGLLLIARK